jgi:hypothetical protein
MAEWMMVPPPLEPGQTAIENGSEVTWRNERGEIYLTGTVMTLERESCLVLEREM